MIQNYIELKKETDSIEDWYAYNLINSSIPHINTQCTKFACDCVQITDTYVIAANGHSGFRGLVPTEVFQGTSDSFMPGYYKVVKGKSSIILVPDNSNLNFPDTEKSYEITEKVQTVSMIGFESMETIMPHIMGGYGYQRYVTKKDLKFIKDLKWLTTGIKLHLEPPIKSPVIHGFINDCQQPVVEIVLMVNKFDSVVGPQLGFEV